MALSIVLITVGTTLAHHDESGSKQIPDQVSCDHWAYKEIAELGKKYAADKQLPDAVIGKPYSKDVLTHCLLSLLEKTAKMYSQEGATVFSRDDLIRIAALHEALERELLQDPGYPLIRETIQKILSGPEVPAFEYKIGINGFLRGEGVRNFSLKNFGYAPKHGEGRFLYRVKPYSYWHPADYLDIHLEGQGYGFSGGNQHSDKYSLYQGFVEARLPEKDWFALKIGRQEFSYGSTFILGPDSFYNGLSFDAARLRLEPMESLTVDILGGRYVTRFSDGLKGNLTGVYVTFAPSDNHTLEAYAFRDTGSSDHHAGERLDIVGLCINTMLGPLSLAFEPVYESGRVFNPDTDAHDRINAYGGHIDLTGEWHLGEYRNKLFLSYAVGSGNGSTAREFRNPNNDTPLIGDMNVVGDLSGVNVGDHRASSIQVYTLGWGIDISKKLNFSATGHYFFANNVEGGFSRHLGLESDFTLTYMISRDFSVILAYDRFFTGRFFLDASGSGNDIHYAWGMINFNFDKTKLKVSKK